MTPLRPAVRFIPFNSATAPLLDKPIRDELASKKATVVQNIANLDVIDLKGIGGVRGTTLYSIGVHHIGELAALPVSRLPAGCATVQAALHAAMHK